MGLALVFSKSFILCILREFVIKYYKINTFSFISQNWMSFVMWRFGGDLKIIIQTYSKKENHEDMDGIYFQIY